MGGVHVQCTCTCICTVHVWCLFANIHCTYMASVCYHMVFAGCVYNVNRISTYSVVQQFQKCTCNIKWSNEVDIRDGHTCTCTCTNVCV